MSFRFNGDCVENYFSCLRGIGGFCTHPTPLQCMQRIRILTLTKNAHLLVKNPSVEVTDSNSISSDLVDAIIEIPSATRSYYCLDENVDDVHDIELGPSDCEDEFVEDYDSFLKSKQNMCTDMGLNCIAGFIKRKLKLETHISTEEIDLESRNELNKWITLRSKGIGKMTFPSKELYMIIKRCDRYFMVILCRMRLLF